MKSAARRMLARLLQCELELATPTISFGSAAVATLGIGASTNVDVTLRKAMADTNYQAIPAITSQGSGLLQNLQITGTATILSASVVRVPIKNNGLVAFSGAIVTVNAYHD